MRECDLDRGTEERGKGEDKRKSERKRKGGKEGESERVYVL